MTKYDSSDAAARLGAEIREVRKARGLTLNALSAQLSCSTAYLSRIELGNARVSDQLLQEIGKVLRVDPAWFFPVQSGDGPLDRHHIPVPYTHLTLPTTLPVSLPLVHVAL